MVTLHPADPELPYVAARWPAGVVDHVRAEYRRLAAVEDLTAGGPVVWLSDLPDDLRCWHDLRGSTVVSVCQLVRFPDLGAVADVLAGQLGPEGRFAFVEPTGRAGWWALARATVSVARPGLRVGHLNRDVPWDLRRRGLRFRRIERSVVRRAPWALRFVATGVAEVDPGRPAPGPAQGEP